MLCTLLTTAHVMHQTHRALLFCYRPTDLQVNIRRLQHTFLSYCERHAFLKTQLLLVTPISPWTNLASVTQLFDASKLHVTSPHSQSQNEFSTHRSCGDPMALLHMHFCWLWMHGYVRWSHNHRCSQILSSIKRPDSECFPQGTAFAAHPGVCIHPLLVKGALCQSQNPTCVHSDMQTHSQPIHPQVMQ